VERYQLVLREKKVEELQSIVEEYNSKMFSTTYNQDAANTSVFDATHRTNGEFEQTLIKGIGELFSKEDKKNIRVFKGLPSDPPITVWLREAEITAFINEWDDQQKIRYLSDRLRGEAAEWL
jgi:hypothetical protein